MRDRIRGILNTSKKDFAVILVVLSVISVILISSAIFGFVKLKEVQSREVAYNAEQLRTLAYDKIEGNQYADEGKHVKFAAFFAENYEKNKYSDKLLGACNEIGTKETMYIELGVETAGKLQNGKITINSRNFKYNMKTLKNSILKKDCIGNIREIELNEISAGNSTLLMGDIYASITSADDYSQENEITLTGTWVPDDGSESVEINKTMKVTVDWYGSAKADISAPYTRINLNDFRTSSNKTVEFDFTIMETKGQLLPKQNVIDVTIPDMFDIYPEDVTCLSGKSEYNKDTHKLHIERINGANNTRYTVRVKYPEEAYNQLYNGYTMSVDIEGYYDCYNNKNEEFNNEQYQNQNHEEKGIFRTEKVSATKGISFYTVSAVTADYAFSAQIANKSYISVPTSTYAISKENLIDVYDGNKEVGTVDYTVMWRVTKTTKETETPLGITMKEIEKEGKYGDTWDGYQMSDYVKNTKIYFRNSNFIGETGYVKVYDNDTDTLIKEFTYNDLHETYNSSSKMYTLDAPITHIRIETNEVDPSANSQLEVYCVKEVDKEALKSHFTKEQIAGIKIAKTNLNGVLSNGASVTGSDECAMVTEKSYSTIKVSNVGLSATAKEPVDEKITIEVPRKNVSYADWKNGVFLVGFESSNASKTESPLSYLEINNVSLRNNDNVKISGYELLKKDGKYFIKIVTNNETKASDFTIDVDCKVLVNPMVSSSTIHVNLYSYNDNLNLYHYGTNDRYDVNDNGNTNETVGLSTATINISSLNTFMTTETASDYNEDGEVTIAPNIAEVQKVNAKDSSTEKAYATAKINVSLINNYDRGNVNNVVILGKIPFAGNTYVDESASLGSKFTTTMIKGIQLPDTMSKELKNATKVYYSTKGDPRIEDVDTENSAGDGQNTESGKVIRSITEEWLEKNKFEEITEDTDLSDIKSYLIVIENEKNLVIGRTYTFSYTISIPDDAKTNDVSYSCHKVWYDYTSEDARLAMDSQPNKLGVRVVDYYDFEITKVKKDTDHPVQGAKFKLTEMQDKENQGDAEGQEENDQLENGEEIKEISRIITSDEAGKIQLKNLRINQAYSFQEIQAPEAYELDSKIIRFKVIENTDSASESQDDKYKIVYLSEDGEVIEGAEEQESETINKFNENVTISKNAEGKYTFKTQIENTPKFALNITKTDEEGKESLSGVIFEISNGDTNERVITDSEGKAVFNNLKIDEEYTLKEVYAKGYYLMKDVKFKLESQKEGEKETYTLKCLNEQGTEECDFTDEEIQNDEASDLIQANLNITNEKIPTYKLKIKKVAESKEKIGPEEEKEEEGLEGATFLLERKDMGNSEFFTTDKDGNISVTDLYAKTEGKESITGKYTLKETSAPAGYLNNREEINFVVTKVAKDTEGAQQATDGETNEENAKYEVELVKAITEEDGDDSEDKEASINDFDTIKDIEVDGDTITITIQDKPLFKLTKIDASTNKPLANAEFIIYELNSDGTIGDEAKDPNGNYVGTLNEKGKHVVTTNAQGVITLALGPGNYKAIETGFPEGYEDTPHSEVFTISGGKEDDESRIVDPNYDVEDMIYYHYTTKEIEISTIEDLVDLAMKVKNGDACSDVTVKLMNDLDFTDKSCYKNPNINYKYTTSTEEIETPDEEQAEDQNNNEVDLNGDGEVESIKEELTKKEENAKGFPPIGPNSSNCFSGIFDGQNHTIKNLYINNSSSSCQGLFGYINGAVIKNLTVTGTVSGNSCVGGICGYATKEAYFENCNNECTITANNGLVGGILGECYDFSKLSIKDCNNSGEILNGYEGGGIVGYIYGNSGNPGDVRIKECSNTGNISQGNYAGGIIGQANYCKLGVKDVSNTGDLLAESYNRYNGGIIGYASGISSINIINATNKGDVNGYEELGGLMGYLNNTTGKIYIKNSSNEGRIVSKQSYLAGLMGYGSSISGEIYIIQSRNTGDIISSESSSTEYLGGFLGTFSGATGREKNKIYIKNSYNTGNITGANISNSYTGYIGGLIGNASNYSETQIENSYNTGNIINCTGYIGGLIGDDENYIWLYKCYNTGNITVSKNSSGANVGGLIGRNYIRVSGSFANIKECENLGNIVSIASSNKTTTENIGGIIGYTYNGSPKIENCVNQGNITGFNAEYAWYGGLIGYGSGYIKGSSNSGDILTMNTKNNNLLGGLVGSGSGSYIQTCDNSGKIQVINPKGYTYIGGLTATLARIRIYNKKS